MKQYWLRMLGAWLLLNLATRLVKDAEKTLQTAAATPVIDTTATTVETISG